MIRVIGGAGNPAQEEEQAETQPSEQGHVLRGQQVLVRDMDDPLTGMRRQVDLLVPRHGFEIALDVGFFHEAEPQLDTDHAAAILVALEHRDVIAVFVNVGDFGVRDLDQDQVARKHAVALQQQSNQGGCPIVGMTERVGRHDQRVAFDESCTGAVYLDELRHGQARARGIGGKSGLAPPAPGRHDNESRDADGKRHEAALEEFHRAGDQEGAIEGGHRNPHQHRSRQPPLPIAPRDREHHQRGDQHHAGNGESVGRRQRR